MAERILTGTDITLANGSNTNTKIIDIIIAVLGFNILVFFLRGNHSKGNIMINPICVQHATIAKINDFVCLESK